MTGAAPASPASRRLEGRVILIAGGASGIGRAMAARFVHEGARIAIADLRGADSQSGEEGVLGLNCDVTREDDARECVAATVAAFGRLDGFVHNAAARSSDGSVVELPLADWERELAVSLTGAFLMSKFVVPAMAGSGGGSIVLVASQLGHVAVGRAVAYCAAKAGLIQLARLMAVDHAKDRIRVNSLSPGAVATDRLLQRWPDLETANAGLKSHYLTDRIGEPDEIASAAAFLLSGESSFVTGTDLLVDGGYTTR